MDIEEMRAVYDREQRRDVVYGDAIRTTTPRTVRHLPKYAGGGFVLHTDLSDANAEYEIAAQIAFFDEKGHRF